jgi:DtxR family Mn-dependent transcriptional regulator
MPSTLSSPSHAIRSTESVDNYLKAIYSLTSPEPNAPLVSLSALADRLDVAPASVTNMLQKLSAAAGPLVDYERHRGVRLTGSGRLRALEVLRHHRLLETFLYEVLDYPLDEVHDEAERLEHFISERFEERIAAKLGYPTFDPHGHSIPTVAGEIAAIPATVLAQSAPGAYTVASLADEDRPALRRLHSLGITPGSTLHVLEHSATGSRVRPGHALAPVELPPSLARLVLLAPAG